MNHKDLNVWKFSMDLVELVYQETAKFPKEEQYGLVSQMRRAAISIPSNIAEGSLVELETQYLIAVRLGFIEKNGRLEDLIVAVRKLLIGYRNYLRDKGSGARVLGEE